MTVIEPGPQRIVVTGASGFIGSHVCCHLAELGFDVIAVDADPGWRLHLLRSIDRDAIRFVRTESRWPYALPPEAIEGADAVVHLAYAEPGPETSEVRQEVDQNLRPTLELMDRLPRSVSTLVFASTALVYGRARTGQLHEALPPEPDAPYAVAKVAVEQALAEWAGEGRGALALRFATVYGPAETVPRAIPNFIRAVLAGTAPTVAVAGDARDYIHVLDVARAVGLSLAEQRAGFDVVNVGTGVRTTTEEVAKQCVAAVGVEDDLEVVVSGGSRPPVEVVLSPTKAERVLGFTSRIDLATGLPTEVDWFRAAGTLTC